MLTLNCTSLKVSPQNSEVSQICLTSLEIRGAKQNWKIVSGIELTNFLLERSLKAKQNRQGTEVYITHY